MSQEQVNLHRLLNIMVRLRDPQTGCPWDVQQTFASIAAYAIEEAYELNEAISTGEHDKICDELGDLLLQVVFHAQMASEEGSFDFDDVVRQVSDKMVRRHPHIFANEIAADSESVKANWEDIKQTERTDAANGEPVSVLDGIARTLPAMTRAAKLQKRAAQVGFDWPDTDSVISKMHEELDEFKQVMEQTPADKERLADEIGDILFVAANLARKVGVEPETALLGCNRKFERRFRYVEDQLSQQNCSVNEADLEQMERLWQEAKKQEHQAGRQAG